LMKISKKGRHFSFLHTKTHSKEAFKEGTFLTILFFPITRFVPYNYTNKNKKIKANFS